MFLRLVLDDKDFENQVVKGATKAGDKAGKALSASIGGALTDFGNSAMKVGKSMTRVGDSMTRNVTLPILAAGGATAKLALDFDTTMNQIVGLAKVPRDQIQGVRDDILKMAGDVGRSPQELAEAFYFVASAGFKADEAMKVLEISAKASAAGMGETQDVAKVLGGVLNAYGHENISAARAGDILTAAIQDGAAEASGFAGAIGQVVPTAASLGVSFDQVTAAMAAMTDVGVDVDTAATNLNQIFTSLLKPTKEAEDALNGVGLSAAGLRQELKEKGLLATLRTVHDAFEGNSAAIATVFGNIRALRGVDALLQLDQQQLTDIFNDTAGAVGNLGKAYDDTAGPQRDLAKSMAELQAAAIEIGEDVLPAVVDILHQLAGGAKEFGKWWGSLDDDTKHLIIQVAGFLAVAGPVLALVGRITTGIGGLVKGIGFLITKLPLLSAAIKSALGPLGLLVGLLEGASFAADETTKALGVDYVGTIQKAAFATGDFSGAMTDLLKAQNASGKSADEFQSKVAEGIKAGLSWAAAIEAASDAFNGIPHAAKHAIDGGISEFDRGAASMNASVAGFAKDLADSDSTITDSVKKGITGPTIEELTSNEEKVRQSAIDTITAFAKGILESQGLVKTAIAALNHQEDVELTKAEELAYLRSKDVASAIKDGLQDGRPGVQAAAKAAAADVISRMRALGVGEDEIRKWGERVGITFSEGLVDQAALHAARVHAATLANTVSGYLQGASPPPEGPLHTIDQGARNIVRAWLEAASGMRGEVARTFGLLGGAASGGLAFASPSLSSLPVPSAGMVATTAAAATSGNTAITTQYILNVEGKPKVVGSREDVIDAWQQLGGFGSG